MQINITHFDYKNDLYQACLKIRYEVLRVPLGLEITEQEREQDKEITHILAMVDGTPAGTVSLYPPSLREGLGEGSAKLRQMAVLDKFQGLGLGVKLVKYLENVAKDMGLKEIGLDSRYTAIGFYEKLGYECCSEIYYKIGIFHRDMKKIL